MKTEDKQYIDEFDGRVGDYIAACGLADVAAGPVLVALSGGADSVALLRALVSCGFSCICAHCNFHLRGAESDRDERFVVDLCQSLGVVLHVKHMDVPACQRERGISVEMACRELRYEWFGTLAGELRCQAVAVAHHRDDNVETFFLNALRGSGIAGLAAMKPRNGKVVRPLLCVSRLDVERYLLALGQDFVTDSTNRENNYKRNRIRNVILPALEREFPQASKALAATVGYVRDYTDLYQDLVDGLAARIVMPCGDGCRIPIKDLLEIKTTKLSLLLCDLLKAYSVPHQQCAEIVEIIASGKQGGQHFHTSTHTLSLNTEFIVVEHSVSILDFEYKVDFHRLDDLKVKLQFKHVSGQVFSPSMCNGKTVAVFSVDLLKCDKVILRHWREGDRIRPFGMRGTKLLSDLFTDAKLPPEARKNVWLLEADGEIVWVLGMRAGAAYSVAKSAAEYILLTYCQ